MLGVELLLAAAMKAPLVVRVEGIPKRSTASACGFVITAHVVGGGRQTTCLTRVVGFPGPHAIVHSRGRMTFTLPHGTVVVRAAIVQRFAADGVHARQSATGTIVRGTGRYSGARGTLSGGGIVVDRRTALGRVRLAYRLAFR